MLIIAGLLLAWLVGSIALVFVWRGRPWRLIVGTQFAWLIAVIAGSFAFLAFGLGCFHCTGADVLVVFAIGFAVLIGVGFGGAALVRRLVAWKN